jgi:hypothetical protein
LRAIPQDRQDAHRANYIRLWRALSWLERAEQATEVEDRFISLWIAFNAMFGRLAPDNRPWGDREAMGAFMSAFWQIDQGKSVCRILNHRQLMVLKLIENRYLFSAFWSDPDKNHDHVLHKKLQDYLPRFGSHKMQPIYIELFDRLYVLRNQLFHGASTKGSQLNRRTLQTATILLDDLLPAMLATIIDHGFEHDWGELCYPPM